MSDKSQEDLWDYLHNCISKNYLLILAVTSYTQGKIKSENLPFGVGKTSMGMWLNAWMNNEAWNNPEHWKENINWDLTKQSMFYDYVKLMRRLKKFDGVRVYNALWDDVQMTAPATQSVDKKIYELAFYITGARPEVATITLTCPNLGMIAAPIRNITNVEIIVSQRGIFEVQRIKNYKNFRRPRDDLSKLNYLEEGKFSELPSEVQQWYDDWRVEEKKQWHQNHKGASGGEREDEVPSEVLNINLTEEQRTLLNEVNTRGTIRTSKIRESGQEEVMKYLVSKKLLKWSNSGYNVITSKDGLLLLK